MTNGRSAQKSRTRAALLQAARELSAAGQEITVQAVARQANISKATAYRYFSDPGVLASEATLDVAVTPTLTLLGREGDVRRRVHIVSDYYRDFGREHEPGFRKFLARMMDAWAPDKPIQRGARRIPAFETALEPVRARMTDADFRLLVLCLTTTGTGIEYHIAARDVCGMEDAEADRVGRAAVDALLDRFLPAD
ncbi:TetR/AcrR family transcriptional regulator [Rhodobacter sp. NTK016B]|uniref:TetR/AcrR family transcriptional regulator n=1 Tax=Rhodobacter sp. NTK016B TaxID=2759676 RepID=UPI001A8C82BD|nr:TetR/AcrR family transcriptional regulator [Rhodobacter sp. NTK016B]MBN8293613.1 TetR/AcrR family transcriptional regulator [Rhodobacter sp. NTK016B]